MINSIGLLLAPSEEGFLYPDKVSMLHLSLALGNLSGYLNEKGITTYLHDLNSEVSSKFDAKSSLFVNFYNADLVHDYLRGLNNVFDTCCEKLLSEVDIGEIDSFGISVGADYSLMQVHAGLVLGHYIKKYYKKEIFIGGNNISFIYIFPDVFRELWDVAMESLPFIINGPGEETLAQLINQINQDTPMEDLMKINGLIRKVDGRPVSNKENQPKVIQPCWDTLDLGAYKRYMAEDEKENITNYYKFPGGFCGSPGQLVNQFNKKKVERINPTLMIPYIFNYNCPYSCAFCTQSDKDRDRGSIILGDVEHIINDLKSLKEKYKTKYFQFINNAFNASGKFVDALCKKIIEEDFSIIWSDCGRFTNLTYERLKLMKEAGCVKLTFGLDTANSKMLKLIDKRLDIEHSEQVLRWCYDLGIMADLEVIFGMPQEGDEEFQDTYDYIKRNYEFINYFWVNEYFVVPNSLIGKYPERYGVELIKDNKTYRQLLSENQYFFKKGQPSLTHNAKLFGYNEKDGRSYEQILRDNKRKIHQLNKLQKKEFSEVSAVYRLLLKIG